MKLFNPKGRAIPGRKREERGQLGWVINNEYQIVILVNCDEQIKIFSSHAKVGLLLFSLM